MRGRSCAPLMMVLALGACAEDAALDVEAAGPAIVLGADGVGIDAADSGCRVVLRSMGRVSNGRGGYETDCSSGSCRWVWEAKVDVATGLVGVPHLLYRTTSSGDRWIAARADASGAPHDGFSTWVVRVSEAMPSEGTSATSLARFRIAAIPFLATTDGGRLFDHNRVADPFGTYELGSESNYQLSDDGLSCRDDNAWATWRFSYPDFGQRLDDGPVLAGGAVRLDYDGRRLRDLQSCLGSHGAVSATTLYAGWRFDNGVTGQAEVERWVSNAGQVSATVSAPLVPVPVGARAMEVWFYCEPGFDQARNVKYDSAEGRNYRAVVVAEAKAVDWVGRWEVYRARAGDVIALGEPLAYGGFTNMGLAVQVSVFVAGLTDAASVDTQRLKVWVESDALGCEAGIVTRQELPLAKAHTGPYGNDATYQWGFESALGRCPRGTYQYRVVVSADGGLSTTTVGNGESGDPGASEFRTLDYR
ncbi:MAG: hypothetical protein JNJ59_08075 [Deltaproteobacteria bacterium]|nr:hypothetical protein [Deltaproteobacteria bacterium]